MISQSAFEEVGHCKVTHKTALLVAKLPALACLGDDDDDDGGGDDGDDDDDDGGGDDGDDDDDDDDGGDNAGTEGGVVY